MRTSIWWLRRDLRLGDNQALSEALHTSEAVVPAFVLDPALLASPYVGQKRLAFLFDGLRTLDTDLKRRGGYLVVRSGEPAEVLTQLVAETRADGLYAERDVSPYARKRDARVAETLPLHVTMGLGVHPPEAVRKGSGKPYTIYTPYSRAWKDLPLPHQDELLPSPPVIRTPAGLSTEPIPDTPASTANAPFRAGEAEAQRRLDVFSEQAVYAYGRDRDRMDLDSTSHLSPYLRLGMISARRVAATALEAMATASDDMARKGTQTWLNELIWREFYISILYNFPDVRQQSFRAAYRGLNWDNDVEVFAAWQGGAHGLSHRGCRDASARGDGLDA